MRYLLASILVVLLAADTIAAELYVFTRPDCPPCQSFKRAAAADATLLAGFEVYMIDGHERPELARRFKVRSYPTFVVVEAEREIRRTTGFSSAEGLRQFLDEKHPRRIR